MPRFKLGDNNQVIRTEQASYVGGLRMIRNTGGSYFLACCGMAGIEGFMYAPALKDWTDKAEFASIVYKHLYSQGTVIYVLSDIQLNNTVHKLFQELGAEEIAVFPNLYHRPNNIHLFKFNVRRACGRFCDKYGEPYAEPPKDASEVLPNEDEALATYAYLPVPQQ